MSKLRWAKLWWSDYENDPALRLCSLAAQGLWMRLLCLAASSRVYGHVLVGGEVPSVAQIARIVGDHHRRVAALIRELEGRKVLDRSVNGAIISRRMIADYAEHQRNSSAGKLGGNPQLLPDHDPKPNGGIPQRPLKPPLKAEEEERKKKIKNPPYAPPERGGRRARNISKTQKTKNEWTTMGAESLATDDPPTRPPLFVIPGGQR